MKWHYWNMLRFEFSLAWFLLKLLSNSKGNPSCSHISSYLATASSCTIQWNTTLCKGEMADTLKNQNPLTLTSFCLCILVTCYWWHRNTSLGRCYYQVQTEYIKLAHQCYVDAMCVLGAVSIPVQHKHILRIKCTKNCILTCSWDKIWLYNSASLCQHRVSSWVS